MQLKVGLLGPKIRLEQLLNNPNQLSKSPENGFFDPETVQNNPLRGPNFDLNEPKNGQNDPLRRPNFGVEIMFLEVIYQPFELKIHLKMRFLRPKTIPITILNNFQKAPYTGFLTRKMVGKNLTYNFDFRVHISFFRAKIK